MKTRLLIVDDHQIILDSLSLLISTLPNIEVVNTLSDSRQVLTFLRENEIDILVTDLQMPFLNGIDLTLLVRQEFTNIRVLMLTVSEEAAIIREAFKAGISGYIMKKASKAELNTAITTLVKGDKYFNEAVMQVIMSESFQDSKSDETYNQPVVLTPREIEIVRLVAQEFSTTEIADRLFISAGTVESHRHNILRKLNVKNSIGIIKYAMLHHLI